MIPAPRTLTELFLGAVSRGNRPGVAMRHKRDGRWVDVPHAELLAKVEALTVALRELGVRPGDRVGLMAENRPEWAIVDYACLCARAMDVPIYPTLPGRQVAYILNDAGVEVLFASTKAQVEKARAIRGDVPALRHVIALDADAAGGDVRTLDAVLADGRAALARHAGWREEALAAEPGELATLIYTSGTTGDPKGVMLTHANLVSNVVAAIEALAIDDRDECLSFLPLSHIFERMAGHYLMLHQGVVINYAGGIETVAPDMLEVKPTVMLSVPRLYEKIHARVLEGARNSGAVKRALFAWALRTGLAWSEHVLTGKRVPAALDLQQRVADRLVFAKIRERTGGRVRTFVSGGAPLNPEVARFFFAAGLPILEGYGLTETSPVITVNRSARVKIGTVGPTLPGVEVRIAEDGEILTRGPHVMRGYWHKPEATAEVLAADGWFHTGDIGELDGDGFLRITDRKKDLIVTAGGKNIAPQPIENLAKTSRFVSNAVMIGDRRKFPVMLVVPQLEPLKLWAEHERLLFQNDADLVALPEVQAKMDRELRKVLRDLAQFEMPKKFLLLPHDFTIEAGELTPKLSVRRRVIEERYREPIEALYRGG
ncbi:MAG: long-chain fatty acid--CoA ligase [Gemmatimonadales bacterium]|nr:long-chain fatty acid--CoA ligase [Gemmatimonadales bacterium]